MHINDMTITAFPRKPQWISNLLLLNALLLSAVLSGCNKDFLPCEKGEGEIVTESRNLKNFNEITLKGSGDVVVSKDSAHRFSVSAQENLLKLLDIRVEGEKLIIDREQCFRDHKDIQYEIALPQLRGVKISGSGKFLSHDTFNAPETNLKITGSGDIQLPVNSEKLNAEITGSGNITVSGEATQHEVKITGSGDLFAFNLPVARCGINISGSGDCYVNVSDQLDVKITGSGDVYYRGKPDINSNISGSGEVKREK